MSRPKESEPITKVCCSVSPSSVVISPVMPGSRSRLPASNSDGSTVPSQGAATAMSTISASRLAPMRTDQLARTRRSTLSCMASVADARVEEHVRQVDQQVDEHVDEREEQDQALHRREVAREHRVHGQ